ncbi:MAG: hypothetical protein A3I63_03685 [Betaproteobacteria bacterium RIFCSPLOWO2_02_FULL_66_14]|nr:MAG: hypothetical protein A3I63_03685 [Betaproteobacteria bacterium RIFCSPLOWO2_02_FULL_66_14]
MKAAAIAAGCAVALLVPWRNGWADWTLVSADNGIHSSYADPATIHKHGAIVSMHGMYNFARGDFTPEGQRLHSTSVLREYDCVGRRVRLISHADHSGEYATGGVISATHRPRPWQPVLEDSGDAAFLKLACQSN